MRDLGEFTLLPSLWSDSLSLVIFVALEQAYIIFIIVNFMWRWAWDILVKYFHLNLYVFLFEFLMNSIYLSLFKLTYFHILITTFTSFIFNVNIAILYVYHPANCFLLVLCDFYSLSSLFLTYFSRRKIWYKIKFRELAFHFLTKKLRFQLKVTIATSTTVQGAGKSGLTGFTCGWRMIKMLQVYEGVGGRQIYIYKYHSVQLHHGIIFTLS